MAASVEVPFNTMLADLDAAIRSMLETELAALGFDGIEIAFDAPTREWSAGVSAPTLNLFLYDLRESDRGPAADLTERRANGRVQRERPALQLDCAYSITAWTRAVQDEHRMLSQVLAILLAHEQLPREALGEGLASSAGSVKTRVGRPKRDGAAEFWTALGGQYKLSLDYVAIVPCDPGVSFHRGPPTRTQTVHVADRAARGTTTELHRTAGVVRDAAGRPVAGAWLAVPAVGAFATAGPDGRFVLPRVPAGSYECECRTPQGLVATAELIVPGSGLDLTLPGA
jgi:hypothetical protein